MHKWIGLLFLSAGIAASEQNSVPSAAAESPTFRAGTKLVEVDVVARSKGAPATGLTKDDFTLLDNGKPQKIAFFSVRSPNTSASSVAATPLPPGTFSNRAAREGGSSGSTTVVLVDQLNTPQVVQLDAIPRIAKFIEMRRLNDRIGIYTLQSDGSLQVMQELTDDGDLLKKAAKSLRGRDPNRRSSDTTGMSPHAAEAHEAITLIERGMDTKHALQAIARHLSNVPGRKTLVWLTTAFPPFVQGLIDFRPDLQEAARSLNDANTALYAVDPRGLVGALSGTTGIGNAETPVHGSPRQIVAQMGRGGESQAPNGFDTMNMLASLTGGRVFKNDNGIGELIQEAVDDGGFTYTLGFYPQEEQDGAWHKLKVEVARHGVSMRYRENYFAARAIDETKARPDLGQLLRDPLDSTQLELVAETAPDPERPGVLRIKVNVDLHNIELRHENAIHSGAVDLSFYVRETGKAMTRTFKIDIPDAQFAAYVEKGLSAVQSVDTRGGVEAVRVVAQDRTTGAAGSVTIPVRK
ncbi:MAG TPA: VWA domain-containing protein [Bryobacteraceae bacterium]|jgi:VWFA-related protein|nr:VWA domain-containing protein [Bryobacteraceae bacterium]